MPDKNLVREKLKNLLPRDRYQHSLRVEKAALSLARHYKVSRAKASIAALLHDCSRFLSPKQMLKQAKAWKIEVSPIERFQPKLLHAKLSAIIAGRKFNLRDRSVLSAIERHTVGAEKMSRLEKIIYLADHIEDGRNYKGVNKVRRLAFLSLEAAMVESANAMICDLIRKRLPVFEGTIKTRNAQLFKII